jgi:hypothetical protein
LPLGWKAVKKDRRRTAGYWIQKRAHLADKFDRNLGGFTTVKKAGRKKLMSTAF